MILVVTTTRSHSVSKTMNKEAMPQDHGSNEQPLLMGSNEQTMSLVVQVVTLSVLMEACRESVLVVHLDSKEDLSITLLLIRREKDNPTTSNMRTLLNQSA